MNYNAIAMAAIVLAAALAGVALFASEADAAGETAAESTEYTITIQFDDGTSTSVSTVKGTHKFTENDIAKSKVPTNYELSGFKDVNSGVVYDLTSSYTFTQDVKVSPVFSAKVPIIIFDIDGKQMSIIGSETAFGTFNSADFIAFAEKAGVKIKNISTDGKIVTALVKEKYVFKAFQYVPADKDAKDVTITYANEVYAFDSTQLGTAEAGEYLVKAVFEPEYTIYFMNGDSVTASAKSTDATAVESEIKAVSGILPADPTRDNYEFVGWALNGKIVTETEKGAIVITQTFIDSLTGDVTLTAVFEPVKLTVTFDVDGSTFTETVLYGEKAVEPKAPVKEGYSFAGWFVGEAEFDFSAPVTADVTVTAKFTETPVATVYKIVFVGQDGIQVAASTSDAISKTTVDAPSVEGKKFVGWYNGAEMVKDYKTYTYTADTTLTAVYTDADAPAAPGFFETDSGKIVAFVVLLIIVFVLVCLYRTDVKPICLQTRILKLVSGRKQA